MADVNYYYLNCPYNDKDEAKSLGARFDGNCKQWFVPANRFDDIEAFNKWRPDGKVFLRCPYEEKDAVKALGARWDRNVQKWFIPGLGDPKKKVPTKFQKWLPSLSPSTTMSPDRPSSSTQKRAASSTPEIASPAKKKKAPSSNRVQKGSKDDATLLRINPSMTVGQLQDECRFRDIKGISGKAKGWYLEQLGIGSVWQHARVEAELEAVSAKTKQSSKSSASSKKDPPERKPSQTAAKKGSSVKKEPGTKKKATTTRASASTTTPVMKAQSVVDLALLPRVTTSLTVTQLAHELMCRDATAKGLSNKPKSWFLERLGVESIWTTSPDVDADLLRTATRVSASMTTSQLVHEVMTRDPLRKGLSSKTKADLLGMLCIGTICISMNAGLSGVSTASTAKKPKKVTKSTKKTGETVVKREEVLSLPKTSSVVSSNKKTETSKRKQAGNPAKASSALNKKSKIVAAPKPTKLDAPGVSPTPASTTSRKVKAQSISSRGVDIELESCAKKPAPVPSTVSSMSSNAPAVAQKSAKTKSSASRGANKTTIRSKQAAPVPDMACSRSSNGAAAAQPKQVVSTQPRIPIVSASMSIARLKEECKARDPNVKGLSKLNKGGLIRLLGAGTEVTSSEEWREKSKIESLSLHIHVHQNCHPHALADSSILRAPRMDILGTCTWKRRVNAGRCDIAHDSICESTPYRTCDECDWDICKACFALECLPSKEKEAKLQRHRDALAAREAERRLQWKMQLEQQRREWEGQEREEELRREAEAKRFTKKIRNPPKQSMDQTKKLKFTVWTRDVHRKQSESDVEKEFDSSFATLDEANLRAEYVFYYNNPWGCEKDEMYADADEYVQDGMRMLRSNPDGGGSFLVSVTPSEVFDILETASSPSRYNRGDMWMYHGFGGHEAEPPPSPKKRKAFSAKIRNPPAKHKDRDARRKFTVWTSCGYDRDGWHSYEGPPEKEFNSSFDTLEEANSRAEYVFYYENPWGHDPNDEYDFPHVEVDRVDSKGFRLLECCPDDSERWKVSVVPSVAFDYLNT